MKQQQGRAKIRYYKNHGDDGCYGIYRASAGDVSFMRTFSVLVLLLLCCFSIAAHGQQDKTRTTTKTSFLSTTTTTTTTSEIRRRHSESCVSFEENKSNHEKINNNTKKKMKNRVLRVVCPACTMIRQEKEQHQQYRQRVLLRRVSRGGGRESEYLSLQQLQEDHQHGDTTSMLTMKSSQVASPQKTLWDVLKTYWYYGWISFGTGDVAHVAMLQQQLTKSKLTTKTQQEHDSSTISSTTTAEAAWMLEEDFLELYAAVQLLPGPTSTQLVFITAMSQSRLSGGLLAVVLWILPGFLLFLAMTSSSVVGGGGLQEGLQSLLPKWLPLQTEIQTLLGLHQVFLRGIPPATFMMTLKSVTSCLTSSASSSSSSFLIAFLSFIITMYSNKMMSLSTRRYMFPLLLLSGGLLSFLTTIFSNPKTSTENDVYSSSTKLEYQSNNDWQTVTHHDEQRIHSLNTSTTMKNASNKPPKEQQQQKEESQELFPTVTSISKESPPPPHPTATTTSTSSTKKVESGAGSGGKVNTIPVGGNLTETAIMEKVLNQQQDEYEKEQPEDLSLYSSSSSLHSSSSKGTEDIESMKPHVVQEGIDNLPQSTTLSTATAATTAANAKMTTNTMVTSATETPLDLKSLKQSSKQKKTKMTQKSVEPEPEQNISPIDSTTPSNIVSSTKRATTSATPDNASSSMSKSKNDADETSVGTTLAVDENLLQPTTATKPPAATKAPESKIVEEKEKEHQQEEQVALDQIHPKEPQQKEESRNNEQDVVVGLDPSDASDSLSTTSSKDVPASIVSDVTSSSSSSPNDEPVSTLVAKVKRNGTKPTKKSLDKSLNEDQSQDDEREDAAQNDKDLEKIAKTTTKTPSTLDTTEQQQNDDKKAASKDMVSSSNKPKKLVKDEDLLQRLASMATFDDMDHDEHILRVLAQLESRDESGATATNNRSTGSNQVLDLILDDWSQDEEGLSEIENLRLPYLYELVEDLSDKDENDDDDDDAYWSRRRKSRRYKDRTGIKDTRFRNQNVSTLVRQGGVWIGLAAAAVIVWVGGSVLQHVLFAILSTKKLMDKKMMEHDVIKHVDNYMNAFLYNIRGGDGDSVDYDDGLYQRVNYEDNMNRNYVKSSIPQIPLWHGATAFLLGLWLQVASVMLIRSNDNNYTNALNPLVEIFARNYRLGSLLFGLGPVLVPCLAADVMMHSGLSETQFFQGVSMVVQGTSSSSTNTITNNILPGPIINLGAYIGAIQQGWKGAIVATLALAAPGALWTYACWPVWCRLRHRPWFRSISKGVVASAVGILVAACIPMYTASIQSTTQLMILVACGVMMFVTDLSGPMLILFGAILGTSLPWTEMQSAPVYS